MRHMVPAYEFRRRARVAMKAVMPILLVVALIATLPSLANSAITLVTDSNPNTLMTALSNRLTQVMEKHGLMQSAALGEVVVDEALLNADVMAAYDQYMVDLQTFLKEKGPIVLALTAMVLILSPVLTLGMINALLHALRKQEFTPAIALSRLPYFFKSIGLELMLAVKLIIWMLPGTMLMIAALFLPETLMLLAMIVGLIALIVMGVMAGYRYAMAVFVLADRPETRIRDCIRRSVEVMHRRKMELFSLEISFIGWSLLLSYLQMMFNSFGAVIGMTLGMFCSLFLTVYTNCAQAAFYQEYAVGPVSAPAQEAPADDTLND